MTRPTVAPPAFAPQWEHDRPSARRRLLWTAFAVALLISFYAGGAQGADRWMSRPSYFSHHVPPHLAAGYPAPVSREAYRPAWVGDRPGFSASGAVRMNRVQFHFGGTNDTTLMVHERAQVGP
ncbi:hypothetical protein [Alienimonas chondri]|uniref:M23 family peptidase n=1 Tax=Alienimonas chondri TaxID=2681879 RepID=A0ABX1VFL6_9PLAN|nr:hypothetical protein [Alienimonas chondri]NNJ26315.1 hypothetical protein [Alienimonas chondri]